MNKPKFTIDELQMRQALPLNLKIRMTEDRIREWVNHYGIDGIYVSFSGGKDSTVLLDIVRKNYPNAKAMFVDVPTQYPELRQFVKTFDNVDIVRPKIGFVEVCEKYGFPFFSKEISECVQGARKYLKSLSEDQENSPYGYWYDRVCGQGKYAKADKKSLKNPSGGGYDRKYRRTRGIGEFAKRSNEKPKGWEQPEVGYHVGNADREWRDQGEYP